MELGESSRENQAEESDEDGDLESLSGLLNPSRFRFKYAA